MTDAATPETATAPEVHDLASAARAIERIIRRETAPGPNDGGKETPAADDDPEEADEEAGAEEEAVEHDPGVDDDEEGDDADDGESEEARYKVKVGGEETEVTLKELIKGYQRGADYTKKTMRLADERRSLERAKADLEQERATIGVERAAHAERLNSRIPQLKQQLAQFDGIDWNRLSAENPTLFAQAKPLFESLSQQLQQAEAERLEHEQRDRQRRLQAVQAHQDYIAEQKRALIAKHPEMADPVKGCEETAALTRYLIDTGYRPEELSRLVDHRDFILARKAMLYDGLMASRDKVKETVAALSRVQKPGTARGSRTGAAERRASLMRRLERSGRMEDAARVIEEML